MVILFYLLLCCLFFIFKVHASNCSVASLTKNPTSDQKTAFQLTFNLRLFYSPEKKSSKFEHFRSYFFFTKF